MVIHHFGYLVKDMDAAIKAFEALGYSVELDRIYVAERKQWNVFMKSGECRVELVQPSGENNASKANASNLGGMLSGGVGVYHICFLSEDFDNEIVNLKKNGFMPISKIEEETTFNGARMQFFFSNKIGLVEVIDGRVFEGSF